MHFTLSRYILPSCFGKLSSRDYHGCFLNFMYPRFPTHSLLFFPGLSACFLPVFLRFLRVCLPFPLIVFPVSYFMLCVDFLFPSELRKCESQDSSVD